MTDTAVHAELTADVAVRRALPAQPSIAIEARSGGSETMALLTCPGTAGTAPLVDLISEASTRPIRSVPKRAALSGGAGTYVGRPRGLSGAFRVGLIIVATGVAFGPAIRTNVLAIIDGSPTAYLLLLPFWALIIMYSVVHDPSRREINDTEFDMILTVLIMGVAGFSSTLALPRIPAAAAFWHAELVLPMIWILGLSVSLFGVRRVFRAYPAWLFVAACFPPNFLIAGSAFGGSTVAFGLLTVVFAVSAITIALRRSKLKWFMAPILLAAGSVGVLALHGAQPAVVYLLPAGVLTLIGALAVRTSHQLIQLTLPQLSPAFVIVALLSTVLMVFVAPVPTPYLAASDLARVKPDWVKSLSGANVKVSGPTVYDWGPRVLGEGGSAQRFRLEHNGLTAYLDVFSTRDLGRFASTRLGVWYGAAPPAHAEEVFSGSDSVIEKFTTLDNRMGTIKSPDDPVWAARGWYWRCGNGNQTVYQSVYLITSRLETAPNTVPTPEAPSPVSTVIQPMAFIIRAESRAPDIPPYRSKELTGLARLIVSTAGGLHS
ncbi:hypothetical protein [Mycolicibacterium celeriflavum]|uniref:hypothetical protein n=1 Tax=Mycolicibacterium celeriflavum TaxID=1249101 RepID=UPI003CED13F1